MTLEQELLGVYIAEDSQKSSQPKVDVLTKEDRPFYELGKICSIEYMKQPLAAAYSPEMDRIQEEVFGHVCYVVGKACFKKNKAKFMEYATSQNMFMSTEKLEDAFKDELTDLFDNIKSAYFTALSEFSIGFWEGATQKTCELTRDMFTWNVEYFKTCWNMFGFGMPDDNADEFMTLLSRHDLPGMIKLYHDHSEDINKAHKGADKFIEFVESRMQKQ